MKRYIGLIFLMYTSIIIAQENIKENDLSEINVVLVTTSDDLISLNRYIHKGVYEIIRYEYGDCDNPEEKNKIFWYLKDTSLEKYNQKE